MRAALDNGSGADNRKLCLVLQLGNGERATVAHSGTNLGKRKINVVLQGTSVGNVGIYALFESHALLAAAQVIALPVACTAGTFAPVLLHVLAVYHNLVVGSLVETSEVATQHDEVGHPWQVPG